VQAEARRLAAQGKAAQARIAELEGQSYAEGAEGAAWTFPLRCTVGPAEC
jgi:hypothetical protein